MFVAKKNSVVINKEFSCVAITIQFLKELSFYLEKNEYMIDLTLEDNISNVLETCGFQYSRCGMYKNNCDGFTILHYRNMSGLDIDNFWDYPYIERIDGNITVYTFPLPPSREEGKGIKEVWNVCVKPEARNKGVARKMFQFLHVLNTSKQKEDKIWLGIDPENPMWNSVLKLYIELGYRNPYVVESGGKKGKGKGGGGKKKIIALTREGETNEEENRKTRIKANLLRKEILGEKKEKPLFLPYHCQTNLIFSLPLIRFLKTLLDRKVETACPLRIKSSREGGGNLGLIVKEIVKGDKTSVSVPKVDGNYGTYNILFHVHPSICYKDAGCYLAWPSAQDISSSFELFITAYILCNFVITVEGIYGWSFTPPFLEILNEILIQQDMGCLRKIMEVVRKHFLTSNEVGEFLVKNPEPEKVLRNFINKINQYTLSDLLRNKELSECLTKFGGGRTKIFKFGFINWKTMEENKNAIFPLFYKGAIESCEIFPDPYASSIDIF